jgi:hypothetical protein
MGRSAKRKAKKPKKKMGRPSDYRPEYCEMLIKHMGDEGLSFEAFAGVVKKDRDTLYQWEKRYPDFADAKKKATALNLLFWEKIGITGMAGKLPRFNVVAWIFSMKNRHGYRNDPAVDKPPEQDPAIADALAALDREEAARRAGAAAAATDAIKQLDSEEAKKP